MPPGPIAAGASRNVVIVGDLTVGGTLNQGGEPTCVVPAEAAGVFINVVAVGGEGFGHLIAYPFGSTLPLASTLNFAPGQTIANGVLVPICSPSISSCPFHLTLTMGPAAAHVVIDVTGYVAP